VLYFFETGLRATVCESPQEEDHSNRLARRVTPGGGGARKEIVSRGERKDSSPRKLSNDSGEEIGPLLGSSYKKLKVKSKMMRVFLMRVVKQEERTSGCLRSDEAGKGRGPWREETRANQGPHAKGGENRRARISGHDYVMWKHTERDSFLESSQLLGEATLRG